LAHPLAVRFMMQLALPFALYACGANGQDPDAPPCVADTHKAIPALNCMCVFDIDRTLTSKQDMIAECPNSIQAEPPVHDWAYDGGLLRWGELLQNYNKTFCGKCYPGIVTAGDVGGFDSVEKRLIVERLANVISINSTSCWAGFDTDERTCYQRGLAGPFAAWCDEEDKMQALKGIQEWYRSQGINLSDGDIYFFDDKQANIEPFEGSDYNAHLISCKPRDGTRGFCGATLAEINDAKGVGYCSSSDAVVV